jgi:translocator protein
MEGHYKRMAFAVLPVTTAAALGGWGARDAKSVYRHLEKPAWAPPASVFAPVWVVLYVLIAAAGWRIGAASRSVRWIHLGQLALNAAWPTLFFARRNKRGAAITIGLLDAALVAELVVVWRQDRRAGQLLLPYLLWSVYATALNVGVSELSSRA